MQVSSSRLYVGFSLEGRPKPAVSLKGKHAGLGSTMAHPPVILCPSKQDPRGPGAAFLQASYIRPAVPIYGPPKVHPRRTTLQ